MGGGRGGLRLVQGEQHSSEALAPGGFGSREDLSECCFCEVYDFLGPVVVEGHVVFKFQVARLVGVCAVVWEVAFEEAVQEFVWVLVGYLGDELFPGLHTAEVDVADVVWADLQPHGQGCVQACNV